MPGPVFKHGDSVELRTIESEDAAFLQEVINDPRVRDGLMQVEPLNEQTERDWIDSMGDSDDTNLLVCVDGGPVGSVTLKAPHDIWGRAELGYLIAPAEWGNGYGTDAVQTICDYAFEERRLNKLYATVYETNQASCRVLEKVGFTEEGILREEGFVDGEYTDLHRYGLLKREWADDA